jgi:hypothetical protein
MAEEIKVLPEKLPEYLEIIRWSYSNSFPSMLAYLFNRYPGKFGWDWMVYRSEDDWLLLCPDQVIWGYEPNLDDYNIKDVKIEDIPSINVDLWIQHPDVQKIIQSRIITLNGNNQVSRAAVKAAPGNSAGRTGSEGADHQIRFRSDRSYQSQGLSACKA